ncbi:MAG TPA: PKD domain-containing protein [Desulfomonilia bacterium]
MKRNAILLAILSMMAILFSGCITAQSPTGDVRITTGDSQKFSVTGSNNGPYSWYWNDAPITGAEGASYTYIAKSADVGENTLRVETTDKLSGSLLFVEWKVTVVEDLKPVAVISGANPLDVTFDGVTPVTLDGSNSFDPESKPLTYMWEIVSQPSGSTAKIAKPGDMITSFIPDKMGAYTIRLMVNDGRLNSLGAALAVNAYITSAPPTANAGADQNVLFGNTAQLDGTGSFDPASLPLTYKWTIDSGPSGTAATLDDATKANPVFSPDKKGMYVISLVVNNGVYDSNTDFVVITVYNNMPIAKAGAAIYVPDLGGTAHLNGSGSYDPDGTTLSFEWILISKPQGSTAALSSTTIANPTLTCDRKGAYIAQLTVSDGDLSATDQVLITCSDQVPVADAGSDITVPFLSTANLDGSGSYDPDGDPLTYAWSILSAPVGSMAALSSTTIVNPTFTPDIRGVYEIQLVVTDNDVPPISSAPDTVLVTVTNHLPVANAGSDINVSIGGTANLFGSGSDYDGDAIEAYAWTVINAPYGSTADVSDPAIANPTFTPDLRGDYTIGLSVYDGMDWSLVDTMQVHVFNNRPIAVPGPDQAVHYANRNSIHLDGSASWDPDGDPIKFYRWEVTSKPEGSNPVFSNDLIANPTLSIDKFGTYQVSLIVSDGNIESPASTMTITTPFTRTLFLENWESGAGDWYQVNSGSILSSGVVTTLANSPTHSWSAAANKSGTDCSGATRYARIHKNLPPNSHVVKVSAWNAWRVVTSGTSGQGNVSNQKFWTGGSSGTPLGTMFQSPDQNTWYYNEIELNQPLTDIGLGAELFTMRIVVLIEIGSGYGQVFWDDIQVTVWD